MNLVLYGYKQDEILTLESLQSLQSDRTENNVEYNPSIPLIDLENIKEFTLDEKIQSISIGQSHALLLTNNNTVYSCGSNQFGQRGGNATSYLPKQIEKLSQVTKVSAGLCHSACLTKAGKVFIWGRSQIDQDEIDYIAEPIELATPEKISDISCGGQHTLMLSQDGKVYSLGDNSWGQLGVSGCQSVQVPQQVFFDKKNIKIINISSGLEHSLFLSDDNQVFCCGNNLFSQCGLESVTSINKPIQLSFNLNVDEVVQFIYTSNGTFSACITNRKRVFLWGTGSWGHARKPTLIHHICEFSDNEIFKQIHMGDNYAILQTSNDKYFLLGNKTLELTQKSKINCEQLSINTGLMLYTGYKLMIIIKSENPQKEPKFESIKQNKRISLNEYFRNNSIQFDNISQQPSVRSPVFQYSEIQEEQNKLELNKAQQQIEQLKKELDESKKIINEKDFQINELNSVISSMKRNLKKLNLQNNEIGKIIDTSQPMKEIKLFGKDNSQNETFKPASQILKQSNCFITSQSKQNDHSGNKKCQKEESRFKKVDEEQFSLSHYNLKSIRSITPYESSASSPFEKGDFELKKQINHFSLDEPQKVQIQNVYPETSKNEVQRFSVGERTSLKNGKISLNSTFELGERRNSFNTNILDKICNYQKSAINKYTNSTKPLTFETRPPTIFQPRSILNDSTSVKNQSFNGRPSTGEKQYEDFFKLRG